MNHRRARTAALAFGMGALAGTLGFACSGEIVTNFGPPGGLSGAQLPSATGVTMPTGGGKKDSGMAPCTYKVKEAGAPVEAAAEAATDAPDTEASVPEDSGAAPDVTVTPPPAEGGSPVGSTCGVSWTTDIFTNMGAAGAWQCANAACHGPGSLQTLQITDDETTTYNNLAAYSVENATGTGMLPFILPCSTDYTKSAFVYVTTGGTYGPEMPVTSPGGPTALTTTQLGQIKTWILCGAPDN